MNKNKIIIRRRIDGVGNPQLALAETRRMMEVAIVGVIAMEAEKEPSSPNGEEEAVFELKPKRLPHLPRRSEANKNGFFHSEERFVDSLSDALLP